MESIMFQACYSEKNSQRFHTMHMTTDALLSPVQIPAHWQLSGGRGERWPVLLDAVFATTVTSTLAQPLHR